MAAQHETPVILVGLNSLPGIQAAQLFARHDVPVIALVNNLSHPFSRSGVCNEIHIVDTKGDGWVDYLESLAHEFPHPPVLLPCEDTSVLALSRHRGRLEDSYRFLLPDAWTVERLVNKLSFVSFAQTRGLPIPPTVVIRDASGLELATASLRFPVVYKPAVRNLAWQEFTNRKVFLVETPAALRAKWEETQSIASTFIAQQFIHGPESELYSCNVYFDQAGAPVCSFVARKLRQWPPQSGSSCMGEECRNDEVLDIALRLFHAAEFRGLGYVEVKRDALSGEYFIIEPNIGRPTGRGFIAEAGGVEMHYAWYCDMVGAPRPASLAQLYGNAKWIYPRQDILAAALGLLRGSQSIREILRSWSGPKMIVPSPWQDPKPFFLDFWRTITLGARWFHPSSAVAPVRTQRESVQPSPRFTNEATTK